MRPNDPLALAAAEGTLTHDSLGFSADGARDVIGIGVIACSEVGALCVPNAPGLGDWQRRVDAGELPIARGHRRSTADRTRDEARRTLLCHGALDLGMLPDDDEQCFNRFVEFERDGLVRINDRQITVTPAGRFFLRTLSMAMDSNGAEHAALRSFSFYRFA